MDNRKKVRFVFCVMGEQVKMSADDWSKCPICKKKKDDIKREKYGKVSAEEYEELMEQFNHPDYDNQEETVREDYDGGPYFDEEGNWCFEGSAQCDVCGTTWEMKAKCKPELFKGEKVDEDEI